MSESFATLLACLRNGTIQIGMLNQPVLAIRAENGQIVLNLFSPKTLVDVNIKRMMMIIMPNYV